MTVIETAPLSNGAHSNQTVDGALPIPEGWAVIPESVGTPDTLENFPFGEIAVEESGGVLTVTGWTPLPIPAPPEEPPAPPSVEELQRELASTKSRLDAAIQSNALLEDCLVEMAQVVYA